MDYLDGEDRHNEENQEEGEGPRCNGNLFGGGNQCEEEVTFGFPILNVTRDIIMKRIPISSPPLFYNKSSEDPISFLFEFNILCRNYNYYDNAHKLKLFPATLKCVALR